MARVLLLTPQLPYPPHQGTSLRNLHLLKAIAAHHRVTLLSFSEPDTATNLDMLRPYARVLPPVSVPGRSMGERLRHLITTCTADMALRLASTEFSAALRSVLSSQVFDVVQVEGIELAPYISVTRQYSPASKVVLDCHNAETELQRRALRANLGQPSRWPAAFYSALQVRRLARFEAWAIRSADRALAVSEVDQSKLAVLARISPDNIFVVPNTIDVASYHPAVTGAPEPEYDLLFTGKMDYRPNVDGVIWFTDKVWPLIRRARPATTFAIVGQRPDPKILRIADEPGVSITGWVPEVRDYLAGAKVYVMPLRIGSGTRLKLLEAMASGKAIVSTSLGAEGLPVTHQTDIFIADSPEQLAVRIVELLDNPARRDQLGEAARKFSERFDWSTLIPLMDRIYADLLREE